jgi:hypothetical protein
MTEDVFAEVQDLLEKILDRHRKAGRRIARDFRKSRGAIRMIDRLAEFGLPVPEDFRALYARYDGAQASLMVDTATRVFGEFRWDNARSLYDGNRIARLRRELPLTDRINVFWGDRALFLDLAPRLTEAGKCPLVANIGTLSTRTFIAFDSTLDFLRSIEAGHAAGAITLTAEETIVDKPAFARIVKQFNRRDVFWEAYATDSVDWQMITYSDEELRNSITPKMAEIMRETVVRGKRTMAKEFEEAFGDELREEFKDELDPKS